MKVGARIYYGWWIVVAAFLNLFFAVGIIFYGLNTLGNLASGRFVAIFISAWLLYYCIARMSGKKGPVPV